MSKIENKHKTINKDLKKLQEKDSTDRKNILMKYEIAQELGLLDKVLDEGWKSLTAKETGKIGGIIKSKKYKEEKNE